MVGNGNERNKVRNCREMLLPMDIIINILKRLPVKTVTQFKCTAKDWAKLIESPYFIAQHLSYSASNNKFLLLQGISSPPPCLIGTDLEVHSPQFKDFKSEIIGSCNGLLCVRHTDNNELLICNPATKQVKQVPAQTLIDIDNGYNIGFGFSRVVNDYKIVRISECNVNDYGMDDDDDDDDGDDDGDDGDDDDYGGGDTHVNRAEVYSITTGTWKEINVVHLQNLCITRSPVTPVIVNGGMFWQADIISDPDSDFDPEIMVSFDIAQEVFSLLKGPPKLESPSTHSCIIDIPTVHNDKLAVFRCFNEGSYEFHSVDVWVLEDTSAAMENWVKKYSVGPFPRTMSPRCFWRDGIVCWKRNKFNMQSCLALVNPYNSTEFKSLPVSSDHSFGALFEYTESFIPVGDIHHYQ